MLVVVDLLQGIRCSYLRLHVALGAGTERAGVRPDPPGGLGAQCPTLHSESSLSLQLAVSRLNSGHLIPIE